MPRLPYPLLLDGGFATELEQQFKKDLTGTLWSAKCLVEDPEAIKAVHLAFYEAGSNVATTCSYQASLPGFIKAGYSEAQAIDAMQQSVRLAVAARDAYKQKHTDDTRPRLVALSIGCYGAHLAGGQEYTGDYGDATLEDVAQFHRERLQILLKEPGVDLILFETVPSGMEAQAIAQVIESWPSALPPVCVSFSCQSDDKISDGTPLGKSLDALRGPAFEALGVNCTKMTHIPSLSQILLGWTREHGKAAVIYPDGGAVWDAQARDWIPNTKLPVDQFASSLIRCVEKGGTNFMIGGCCGVTPRHIEALRANLDRNSSFQQTF
ncbi:Homocysteine S-methyltransferase [Gongronella butleri]|nr:Homocysteine S-methyltransferase [Gongronella butleri]